MSYSDGRPESSETLSGVKGAAALIDLHCHILPGIDDGAADLSASVAMARMAVADGIRTIACTPHITPGVYDNSGPAIRAAVDRLSLALEEAEIPLNLVPGADVHLAPDLVAGFQSGRVLTLADSRYFLFEPPHHVAPPRLEEVIFDVMAAGYVPILTHPERLSWIEPHYTIIERLSAAGVWMQLTAGSLTGRFGKRAKYWSERMLDEGLVQVVSTDAHNCDNRPPRLSGARHILAQRIGEEETERMVLVRPLGILRDLAPSAIERLDLGRVEVADDVASQPV